MIRSSEIETSKVLGSGAQGIVYHAKWKSRDIVFKQLHIRHQDVDEKRLFLSELKVWR
jgi:predicted Ser/Thr protein kinase